MSKHLEKMKELSIADIGKGESQAGVPGEPYTVEVTIEGVSSIIFHRYDVAETESKAAARKNSKEKKSDNLESYVYRHENGEIGVPADCMRGALVHAAKSKADPRSPRKSAMDMIKAVVLVTPEIASLGQKDWDFVDARRAVVQKQGIPRRRPGCSPGWKVKFELTVLDPGYVDEAFLQDLVESAGKFSGLCDNRPQYGRFRVTKFQRMKHAVAA